MFKALQNLRGFVIYCTYREQVINYQCLFTRCEIDKFKTLFFLQLLNHKTYEICRSMA